MNPPILIARLMGCFARFRCACGAEFTASIYHVRDGGTKSCGCLKHKLAPEWVTKHGQSGTHSTKVYRAWKHMKTRCNNSHRPHYRYHGGRGITYDPSWEKFENFYRDMGDPPSPKSTLERIDNNGNYTKTNCAWVPQAVQNVNKRNVVRYEHEGERKTLGEWSAATGVKRLTIYKRLQLGWSFAQAISITPSHSNRVGPRS